MLTLAQNVNRAHLDIKNDLCTQADNLPRAHWYGGTFQALEEILITLQQEDFDAAEDTACRLQDHLNSVWLTHLDQYVGPREVSLSNLVCHSLLSTAFDTWDQIFETLWDECSSISNCEILDYAESACRLMATVEIVSHDLLKEAA